MHIRLSGKEVVSEDEVCKASQAWLLLVFLWCLQHPNSLVDMYYACPMLPLSNVHVDCVHELVC